MSDLVLKQVSSVIDSRTTPICLHAAGQIQEVSEPFETTNGFFDRPPFHRHCRSIVVPWTKGFGREMSKLANAEIHKRPMKVRAQIDLRNVSRIPKPDAPALPGAVIEQPALKVLGTGPRPPAPWQASPDPLRRAVGLWTDSRDGVEAVRTVIRNVDAGRPPLLGVDLTRPRLRWLMQKANPRTGAPGYSLVDLRADVISAALTIRDLEISQTMRPMFRGMRVQDPGTVFAVGDRVDVDLASFVDSERHALGYAGSRKATEGERVVMIAAPGAWGIDLAQGGALAASGRPVGEHLVSGRLRVRSVEQSAGVWIVEVVMSRG